MYYVYVLQDDAEKIYVGYTKDLRRRLSEHDNRKVYTTKRMNKPKLFYYEAYNIEELAKNRERKLKRYGSAFQGLKKRLGLK